MTDTRPIRVALYARVSTSNHGQDVTLQTRELEEFVERRGWALAGEYVDLGISGAKDRRPQLDRLMADARRREFDAVLVWKFDRFARSVSHLLRALETFQELGIDFVSLSESLDTSTPAGKMVFTGRTGTQPDRGARPSRAEECSREKGKTLGRPRVTVDAAKVASLRSQKLSWAKIGEALGLGEGTVRRSAQASARNPSESAPVNL